jgi:hypothetical protein
MILPMSLRMGAWLGALALTIAWLFASVGEPPAARDRVSSPTAQPAPSPTPSQFTQRLQRGLRSAPSAPRPRRNPFQFGNQPQPTAPSASETPVYTPPPSVAPPAPAMTLAGIGTTETPEGPVRTAVVSASGRVWLVKIGEELPTGLRVARIADDHVVLVDASGAEMTLHLK